MFRILATLFVLLWHLNGWMVGGMPKHFDISNPSVFRVCQAFIESITVVCVNSFLIITGFFGVRLKLCSIWKIWLLLISIYIPFYIVNSICNSEFSILTFLNNLCAFTRESYFVQCYLMLMFLSPILNSFIEKYDRYKILLYVIVLWTIEFSLDIFVKNQSLGFNHGYSLIHFVLIYLLGRCAFLFKKEIIQINKSYYCIGYITCALILLGAYMSFGRPQIIFAYTNPIVVIESFFLFFCFMNRPFHNRIINTIASSTFAVYIMHTCSPLYEYCCLVDSYLLSNNCYCSYLLQLGLFILLIFSFCILYDKVRLILTKRITDKVYSYIENKFIYVLNDTFFD